MLKLYVTIFCFLRLDNFVWSKIFEETSAFNANCTDRYIRFFGYSQYLELGFSSVLINSILVESLDQCKQRCCQTEGCNAVNYIESRNRWGPTENSCYLIFCEDVEYCVDSVVPTEEDDTLHLVTIFQFLNKGTSTTAAANYESTKPMEKPEDQKLPWFEQAQMYTTTVPTVSSSNTRHSTVQPPSFQGNTNWDFIMPDTADYREFDKFIAEEDMLHTETAETPRDWFILQDGGSTMPSSPVNSKAMSYDSYQATEPPVDNSREDEAEVERPQDYGETPNWDIEEPDNPTESAAPNGQETSAMGINSTGVTKIVFDFAKTYEEKPKTEVIWLATTKPAFYEWWFFKGFTDGQPETVPDTDLQASEAEQPELDSQTEHDEYDEDLQYIDSYYVASDDSPEAAELHQKLHHDMPVHHTKLSAHEESHDGENQKQPDFLDSISRQHASSPWLGIGILSGITSFIVFVFLVWFVCTFLLRKPKTIKTGGCFFAPYPKDVKLFLDDM